MKTLKQVKEEFATHGISVSEWARTNGFPKGLVYDVLSGRTQNLRGRSHQVAVALGLKQGVVMDAKNFHPLKKAA